MIIFVYYFQSSKRLLDAGISCTHKLPHTQYPDPRALGGNLLGV